MVLVVVYAVVFFVVLVVLDVVITVDIVVVEFLYATLPARGICRYSQIFHFYGKNFPLLPLFFVASNFPFYIFTLECPFLQSNFHFPLFPLFYVASNFPLLQPIFHFYSQVTEARKGGDFLPALYFL